jgi:arylsulfatase A-like enzyme
MKNIIGILVLVAGIVMVSPWLPDLVAGPEDTNVLLITIDTIRADRIGCYGTDRVKTPNIDALAKNGALFTRAFAHNPMTLPSHANILLGATPPYHGVHENSKAVVAENFMTLAEFLRDKGYATGAFIGAFPLDSRFGLAQGFDVYDESYPSKAEEAFTLAERRADKVMAAAMNWLGKQHTRWFAWIHLWDPHAPYLPPGEFLDLYKTDPYSGEIAYTDSELGKLMDFLKVNRFHDNTIIILTGDHGEAFGEHGEEKHGYFAYNTTLWIPLIITGPGIKTIQVKEYVCHIDIFPTVCEMLGSSRPAFLQGISLMPLIKGKKIKSRAIYFESLDAYYNSGFITAVTLP